ncbi:MAG: uracil-DNA glycosylase [Gemmatimonadetes bacterium]|nr:uracil-DNA glycosylase [Gemmatimonadota bacterium]
MGESDLVLDGLAVEDVLKLVGAANAGAQRSGGATTRADRAPGATAAAAAPDPAVADGDWRKVLGASAPPGPAATPGAAPAPDSRKAAAAPSAPAAAAPPSAPDRPASATAAQRAVPVVDSSLGTGRRFEPGAPPGRVPDAPEGIVVGSGERALFGGPLDAVTTLDAIAEMVRACQACGLAKLARNAVPGEGNPNADFVLVGEAPGQSEDETGRPFVGAAGQLLTKIIEAIKLSRDDVYICNVIKHRPPNNRNPLPDEITACSPFLRRQIELLRPKVIVALGTFAAQTLLETKTPIGKLRGLVHRYHGVPLVATYHPAALLRNPSWKRPTWEDVQLARRILDRAPGA